MISRHDVSLPLHASGNPIEVPPLTLRIPRQIERDGEYIVWSRGDTPRSERPAIASLRAFQDFLRLEDADDDAVVAFAKLYGPLELCDAHDLPVSHALQLARLKGRAQATCDVWSRGSREREHIEAWRPLVRTASSIARILGRLQLGKTTEPADWNFLKRESPIRPIYVQSTSTKERQSHVVLQFLNSWLAIANTRLTFHRIVVNNEGRVEPVISGGLFGFIGLELMALLAEQRHAWAICSFCFMPYAPKKRPRPGESRNCQSTACLRFANNQAQRRRQQRLRHGS